MPKPSMSLHCAVALIVPLVAAGGPISVDGARAVAPRPVAIRAAAPGSPAACAAARSLRPPLYEIPLKAAGTVAGAEGTAILHPASTLFGVSVTADGHDAFLVEVRTRGLPAPGKLGAFSTYVAWAARADLSEVVKLGALDAQGRVSGEVSFQKFLVFVTAERSGDVSQQAGPIVLRGLSPSGQMKNMLTEPLLNGGMPPC
jgi:hypothetical protein